MIRQLATSPETESEVRSEAFWVVLNAASCGSDAQVCFDAVVVVAAAAAAAADIAAATVAPVCCRGLLFSLVWFLVILRPGKALHPLCPHE